MFPVRAVPKNEHEGRGVRTQAGTNSRQPYGNYSVRPTKLLNEMLLNANCDRVAWEK